MVTLDLRGPVQDRRLAHFWDLFWDHFCTRLFSRSPVSRPPICSFWMPARSEDHVSQDCPLPILGLRHFPRSPVSRSPVSRPPICRLEMFVRSEDRVSQDRPFSGMPVSRLPNCLDLRRFSRPRISRPLRSVCPTTKFVLGAWRITS